MILIGKSRLTRLLLSGTAVAGLLLPASAHAQGAAPAVVLDPVTVEGQRTPDTTTSPVRGYVPARSATGSKTDRPVEAIPQSVSVIGREEMDDLGAQKVDEALRYTPGVFSQPFGPDSDTNWMFIRGFQATQTGVYQDGLQLYAYGFGGQFVDSYNLERIEVLRGASSVLYGGSNPGGLVNYVTKRPGGAPVHTIETGINEHGTAHLGLDYSDAFNETLSYRLTGRIAGGDTYTDFADGFRGTISPSFRWAPNDRNTLTVLTNYTDIDETHNGGAFLPYVGTVVDASFGRIDREANFTEPGIDKYRRRQVSLGYEFEHRFDNDMTFRQNARFGYSRVHEVSVYPYGYNAFSAVPTDPDNLLSRINFEHKTTVRSFLVDNQLETKVTTGPVAHTLLAGIDYKHFTMDQVQLSGSATPVSATNPVYGAPQGPRFAYIDQELTMRQLGVYLQDQMKFGQGFLLTLSGRHDTATTYADGTPAYDGTDRKLSGRAGLAYEFANGLTPYASVSTFFNPVLGSSPVAGVFKPESGHQYEAGVKYRPRWMDGLFTAALFDLTRRNVVTGAFNAETQLGEVNSRGIELEAKANITENLKATASFTTMDIEIKKDANPAVIGKSPYIVPETQASAFLDYSFRGTALDGVSVGGGVRYIGSSWADNENTLKVPSATVFDARVGYTRDNWGVNLSVTNLFDKEYVASCQTQFSCGYAEARTALLTVNMSW
ncbi:TonB-dependent siderophore receptor [Azospirillum sp. RWY-5-1]|uniref:TonB-dependent siderophore receptor n=1 Tax=Azospirillum oleiclasticum TaxID=2735135 RepID=A0ABX2TM68_9PROT|nr:TonB-dependent siderophore receptor [Azospirillum oleiclasticum]NYZ14571.1 TonB-dependent siderophore receptor [Azospirillum oleiclasticum]NYZ24349.1 TonB-dependent siderophore receptor [Azospirillum oleiclasticum]